METAKKLKIGFQNRKDTFTGKLGFIINNDKDARIDKGSFNNWCDASMGFLEIDNKYETGFLINKNINRQYEYSTSKTIRVYHPRGFEFEIAVENLTYLIANANIVSQEIMAPCLISWSRGKIFLVPKGTPESVKMDKVIDGAFDYEVEKVYLVRNRYLAYMGQFKFRQVTNNFMSFNAPKNDYRGIHASALKVGSRYELSSWSEKEVHLFFDVESKEYVNYVSLPAKEDVDIDFCAISISTDEINLALTELKAFSDIARAKKFVGVVRDPQSLATKLINSMEQSQNYFNSVESFIEVLKEAAPLFEKLTFASRNQSISKPVITVGKKDGSVKFTYKQLKNEDIVLTKNDLVEIVAEPSVENKILLLTKLLTVAGSNRFYNSCVVARINNENYGIYNFGGDAKIWEIPNFYQKLQNISNHMCVFEDFEDF